MCEQKTIPIKRMMNPSAVKSAKIMVVVIFFCFAECVAGSCLLYGHSCYGGHGKRSGDSRSSTLPVREAQDPDLVGNPRWFLARLMKTPLNSRYGNKDLAEQQEQLFADTQLEADPFKGLEDYSNLQEDLPDNILFEKMFAHQQPHARRLRAAKITEKKNAMKMI